MTSRIETLAADLIARIDAMGGAVRAIERGFLQREIQESAYRHQQEVERGERVIVGVNRFREASGSSVPIHKVDLDLERGQVERLRAFKSLRASSAASTGIEAPHAVALRRLESAARGAGHLLPLILDAVEARATLGEISDTLRLAFGRHQEIL
jgi:methylmalonyl-CoA mutase N-terminal domain/subunit